MAVWYKWPSLVDPGMARRWCPDVWGPTIRPSQGPAWDPCSSQLLGTDTSAHEWDGLEEWSMSAHVKTSFVFATVARVRS
jgi:hypothetical protein